MILTKPLERVFENHQVMLVGDPIMTFREEMTKFSQLQDDHTYYEE